MLFLLGALTFSGCMSAGSKCRLTVSNSGDRPVKDVVVEFGGAVGYTSPVVEPHSDANYRPLKEGIVVSPRLTWKDTNGVVITRDVKLAKPLSADFEGRVLLEINNASEVHMFVLPDDKSGASSIPWGYSDTANGTMTIPGLNQQ
jgi:hypothetical protein